MDSSNVDLLADAVPCASPPDGAARRPLSPESAMRRAQRHLRTALYRAAALAAAIGCLLGLINLPAQWSNFPGPRIALVLLAFAVVAGWAIERAIVAPLDRRALQIFGSLAVVALIVQPWWLGPTTTVPDYSPLTHLLVIGAITSAISFGQRIGVLAGVIAAVSTYLSRAQQIHTSQPMWEAILIAVTCLAAVGVVILLGTVSRAVGSAAGELWELQATAVAGRQRELERGRLDALVHDAVLGALLVAGRGQDRDAAARLAEEAVAVLESEGPSGSGSARDWAGRIGHTAARLGLSLDLDARGRIGDPLLADALMTATNEALVNVARHSGQSSARVTARFTPRLLTVTVADRGRGFDPEARGVGRAGIATSIDARLRAFGGNATIVTGPGEGTEVTLRVRPQPLHVEPARWSHGDFAPMVALAFIAIACHGAIAVDYLDKTHLAWVTTLAPLAIASILAWTWWTPPRRASWLAACVVSVTLAAALMANVINPQIADWRLWFVGAFDGIVAVVAFRFSGWAAIGTALAIPTAMAITVFAVGADLNPLAVTTASTQLLVCAILGALLRRGLGQAAATLHRVARRSYDLRVEETARAAREEEVRARIDQLGEACLPMLHRLADGVPLPPADQAECLRIEAAIRDHLVARPLVNQRLAAAVKTARARNVRVELAVDSRVSLARAQPLRDLVCDVLPLVPRGALVRVTWQGPVPGMAQPEPVDTTPLLATLVVLVLDDDLVRDVAQSCAALARTDLRVDADEDVVIVELHDATAEPTPRRQEVSGEIGAVVPEQGNPRAVAPPSF